MAQIKRRAANFSDSEVRLLSQIVIKYLPIIENKRTDSAANGAKEEAWREITDSFNAANSEYEVRMVKTLKAKYDNIKKRSRHLKPSSRPFVYKPNIAEIKEMENNLLAICSNNSSILSFDASNDSDSFSNNQPPSSAQNTVYIKNEILEEVPIEPSDEVEAHFMESYKNCNNENTIEETQNKYKTWPLSLVSQEPQASPNKANDTAKPDPLSEAKLELIRLQIEIANKEHSFKELEHKRKMLYLHNEEVRKKQIHQMMLQSMQQNTKKNRPFHY